MFKFLELIRRIFFLVGIAGIISILVASLLHPLQLKISHQFFIFYFVYSPLAVFFLMKLQKWEELKNKIKYFDFHPIELYRSFSIFFGLIMGGYDGLINKKINFMLWLS